MVTSTRSGPTRRAPGSSTNMRWVFMSYWLPREPSAPRLALWRAVRRLGAYQVSDGLVALPDSARTREHLEWLAAGILDDHGTAAVWLAQPTSARTEGDLVTLMRDAVDEEYRAVLAEAHTALDELESEHGADPSLRTSRLRRLRGSLRRIATRDYFVAPTGDVARAAVERLGSIARSVPA